MIELKGGVAEVINELEKGNKDYEIIKRVPKARQLTFPERYRFFHDTDYHETIKKYVKEDRTGISDWYFYNGEWKMGDTFWNGYTIPEDVTFLGNFLEALNKLSS